MKALFLAAVLATHPLWSERSPDAAWHYNVSHGNEAMRVETTGAVKLRYCDGRLRRVGKIAGRFVPWDAWKLSAVIFDRDVGDAERALVARIVAEVRAKRSIAPWRLECVS